MRRGWLLVVGLALSGCASGATPVASQPPEATAPPVVAAPKAAKPNDDPASCVEPEASASPADIEVAQRFESALGKLGVCTARLKQRGLVHLSLTPTDGRLSVRVRHSSVRDCKVVECLKSGLSELEVPRDPDASSLERFVTLKPNAVPHNESRFELTELEKATSCVDPDTAPIAGYLPPERVQEIVRSNSGRVRDCYEAGLRRDPQLAGRVAIRFLVGRDGRVRKARVDQNTLPDCAVSACLRERFKTFTFPEPAGGVVTVVYPLLLEPG